MNLIGLTRIRNESAIIKDTLDHMSEFCSTVFVYDDCSTDDTVSICENHPIVSKVIKGSTWSPNRLVEEYSNRQQLFLEAKKILGSNDWFVYMDADERIEFDWSELNDNIDAVRMKLFDFYITEEDKDLPYTERKWMGPEHRSILFAFRMGAAVGWHGLDQRECYLRGNSIIKSSGFVKHYGKAISIEEWESTCDYYIKYFPQHYRAKWLSRKGKAIHTISDFGKPLIKWEDRKSSPHLIPMQP